MRLLASVIEKSPVTNNRTTKHSGNRNRQVFRQLLTHYVAYDEDKKIMPSMKYLARSRMHTLMYIAIQFINPPFCPPRVFDPLTVKFVFERVEYGAVISQISGENRANEIRSKL